MNRRVFELLLCVILFLAGLCRSSLNAYTSIGSSGIAPGQEAFHLFESHYDATAPCRSEYTFPRIQNGASKALLEPACSLEIKGLYNTCPTWGLLIGPDRPGELSPGIDRCNNAEHHYDPESSPIDLRRCAYLGITLSHWMEVRVWLSPDPAGFVDGPNLYAYVRNNPWSAFDPHGLDAKAVMEGAIQFYHAAPPNYKALALVGLAAVAGTVGVAVITDHLDENYVPPTNGGVGVPGGGQSTFSGGRGVTGTDGRELGVVDLSLMRKAASPTFSIEKARQLINDYTFRISKARKKGDWNEANRLLMEMHSNLRFLGYAFDDNGDLVFVGISDEILAMFNDYSRGIGDDLVEISDRARIVRGAPQLVEHHVFPKYRLKFFKARGIDVHDYVIDVDDLTHQVLHAGRAALNIPAGWWDQQIMTRIAQREKILKRQLVKSEILEIAQKVQNRFGLGHLQPHRYSKVPK